jgi:hypothetical protein
MSRSIFLSSFQTFSKCTLHSLFTYLSQKAVINLVKAPRPLCFCEVVMILILFAWVAGSLGTYTLAYSSNTSYLLCVDTLPLKKFEFSHNLLAERSDAGRVCLLTGDASWSSLYVRVRCSCCSICWSSWSSSPWCSAALGTSPCLLSSMSELCSIGWYWGENICMLGAGCCTCSPSAPAMLSWGCCCCCSSLGLEKLASSSCCCWAATCSVLLVAYMLLPCLSYLVES